MLLFRTKRNYKQIKIVLELSHIHNPSTWGQEQENQELKASGPQSALEATLRDMRNSLYRKL